MLTKAIRRYLTRNVCKGLHAQRFFGCAQNVSEMKSGGESSGFVTVRDSDNYLTSHGAIYGTRCCPKENKWQCFTSLGHDASTINSIHRWIVQLDRYIY